MPHTDVAVPIAFEKAGPGPSRSFEESQTGGAVQRTRKATARQIEGAGGLSD